VKRIGVVLAVVVAVLSGSSAAAGAELFPTRIALPDGFRPEGIAIGPGPVAYVGSLRDGDIYRVSLRTGRGSVISQGPGTPSLGMKTDQQGRLFVAGGPSGDARVVDTRSGVVLARYQLADGAADTPTFVNDVVLTPQGAWFTDSMRPVLYRLPLNGTRLPGQDAVVTVPITGQFEYRPGYNANGIVRGPTGRELLVVQYNTGRLFRIDPATGHSTEVDLGAELLPNGDGLLLRGTTLYVAQNRSNVVSVVRLAADGTTGRVVERLTDSGFDAPATAAAFRTRLYLPNARPDAGTESSIPYWVTAIPAGR
jgi:sugar lactone lactonase YvrE